MITTGLFPFTVVLITLVLIGYFVASLALAGRVSNGFLWSLAPAIGAGVCSLIDFAFRRPMFTVENLVLILLFLGWLWRRGLRLPDVSALSAWRVPIVSLLLAAALGWMFADTMMRVSRIPHGGWDGWAIWNSHSRYLYRDGKNWQTNIVNTFHPDYPLLVPLMVVRLWRFGVEVPNIGGLFAVLFAFSGVAVLAQAVKEARGTKMGLLFAALLLSTPAYLIHAAYQEADVPLSVFILCTVALLFLHFERARDALGIVALAGFMAGCAGWTKNEGLLFIAAVSAVLLLPILRAPKPTLRRFAAFAVGLALPMAVILYFKLTIAPQSDLTWNRHYAEVVEKIFTASRYFMIGDSMRHGLWTFGTWAVQPMIPLAAFVALRRIHVDALRGTGWWTGFLSVCLVLAGYSTVYVLTPMDLHWHLDSSLDRLLLHLWPTTLLLVALAMKGSPEAALETPASP